MLSTCGSCLFWLDSVGFVLHKIGSCADDCSGKITLDYQHIVLIANGTFSGLPLVKSLSLEGNAIASVPSQDIFSSMSALELLTLKGNLIGCVPGVRQGVQLDKPPCPTGCSAPNSVYVPSKNQCVVCLNFWTRPGQLPKHYRSEGNGSISCVHIALQTPLPMCSFGRLDHRVLVVAKRNGVQYVREKEAKCGDSVRGSTEACDDGNSADKDGCSASCTVEVGYTCTSALWDLSKYTPSFLPFFPPALPLPLLLTPPFPPPRPNPSPFPPRTCTPCR